MSAGRVRDAIECIVRNTDDESLEMGREIAALSGTIRLARRGEGEARRGEVV